MSEKTFTVIQKKGKGRGKKLGVPTINFEIPISLRLPFGIYAGWLHSEEKKYPAAIHFGPRPQFAEIDSSLEAFMLDGIVDLSDANLELVFVRFIRNIKQFPTINAMLKQIDRDVAETRKCLSNSL